MKPEIVIARANDTSFLGHLRTCGENGSNLTSVVHTWDGAGEWYSEKSKWFEKVERFPNPAASDQEYVSQLVALGKNLGESSGSIPFCIPSSDTNLEVFLRHEEQLGGVYRMMGSRDWDRFPSQITDKVECAKILNEVIPDHVPRCAEFVDGMNFDEFRLPVIVKPRRKDYSQSFYQRHNSLKALKLETREEIAAELAGKGANDNLLIQEYVSFESKFNEIPFYAYADSESNIRLAATGIKELIQPWPYGTATVLRLTYHEELLELSRKVAKALKWRGPLMIEFIRDFEDGTWKIIEINTRPWLFHRFYTRHGIDFMGIFLKDIVGELPAGEDIKTPDSSLVGDDGLSGPLHIDIEKLFRHATESEELTGENLLSKSLSFIEEFDAPWSVPQLEENDPGPGERLLERIEEDFGISGKRMIDSMEQIGFWQ